jgi:hypothetical protein
MDTTSTTPTGILQFCLTDGQGMEAAISGAPVQVFRHTGGANAEAQTYQQPARGALVREGVTDSDGCFTCDLAPGPYIVESRAFGREVTRDVTIEPYCTASINGSLPIGVAIETYVLQDVAILYRTHGDTDTRSS